MIIRMNYTVQGSSDGFTVQRFHEGQCYDTSKSIGHGLACQFVNNKQAVVLSDTSLEETVAGLMALLEQQRADRLNATQF